MHVRRLFALLALAPALALAACGSDSASSDEPDFGTKQAAWTKTASDRCLEYQDAAYEVQQRYTGEGISTDEAVKGSLRDGMPLLRDLVADLRAIEVPADVREDWSTFVDGWEIMVDRMPDFADETANGQETDEMREMFTEIGRKVGPVVSKYDLGGCAKLGG